MMSSRDVVDRLAFYVCSVAVGTVIVVAVGVALR